MNRHITTRIIALVAALSLALFASAQFASAQNAGADAQASAVTRAVFYSSHPQQGGEVIAELDADAAASASFDEAMFVVLEGVDFAYTFAVAQHAEAEAGVRVALQHTSEASESATLTLSEVIARLDAALHGDAEIGVFTDGETRGSVVVAIHEVDDDSADAKVEVDSATHVDLIVNGTTESFELAATGDTLADVSVHTASTTEDLVDLTVSLDLDTDSAANVDTRVGSDDSSTEAETYGNAEADAEAEAGMDAGADAKANAEAGVGVSVDVDVDNETEAETETEAESETDAEGDAEGEAEGSTEGDAESEARTEGSASTEVEVGVGVGIGGGDDDSEDSN